MEALSVSLVRQEQGNKNKERDKNMEVITQLDLHTKYVISSIPQSVNVVDSKGIKSYDDYETVSL